MIEEGEEREEKPYWLEVFDVQLGEVQSTCTLGKALQLGTDDIAFTRLLGSHGTRVSSREERMGQKWHGECTFSLQT